MKNKIYVGCKPCGESWETFRSDSTPTTESHGNKYFACIGPFRTMRAARFMARMETTNPHCRCVADAERLSKG